MLILIILIFYSFYISFSNFFCENALDIDGEIFKMNFLYLILSVVYLSVVRKKNLLCPEFFFLISFYFASFLLSFAKYLDIPSYYTFSDALTLKAISLALIGGTFFIVGSVLAKINVKRNHKMRFNFSSKFPTKRRNIFFVLSFTSFILMLYFDLDFYLERYKVDKETTQRTAFSIYFSIFFVLTSFYEFSRLKNESITSFTGFFKKVDKKFIYLLFFVSMFFIYVGDRTSLMQILLPCFILYYLFIHKINLKVLTIIATCFFCLFIFIRDNRAEGSIGDSNYLQIGKLALDFTSINAAIPTIINYTENKGYTMGQNMILQALSVVPFLQSFANALFDINVIEPSSLIISYEILGPDFHSGQGTNVVADLYYSFGIYGVIIGMAFAGYIYSFLFNKLKNKEENNNYYLITFLILFGNLIFFVRVEYLYILQKVSLTLIITYIVDFVLKIKWKRNI